jgi:hypothetical protein
MEQYEQLKAEKERLESTVIEQAAELALLKKKIARASVSLSRSMV